MRTEAPKASEITRHWYVVDADGLVLGRLATEVARLVRGKHKPTFSPHADVGDHVIVVNAERVVLSAGKAERKVLYRHSGYPGGLHQIALSRLMERRPEEVVRNAVRGMLPRNALGRSMLTKLKVYAGPDHPHGAQQPLPYEIPDARRVERRR